MTAGTATLVVDVANVMGSRPDGWWRDRAGAATDLLARVAPLVGRMVSLPSDDRANVGDVVAIVEGAAKAVTAPAGVDVVRAPADGDSAIAAVARERMDAGERVVVVTADRGLRARIPVEAEVAGPDWLNELIGR